MKNLIYPAAMTITAAFLLAGTANAQIAPPLVCTSSQPTLATPVKTNLSLSANQGAICTKGYNINQADRHFCDSIILPTNTDISQGARLRVNTGRVTGGFGTDSIRAGRKNNAGTFIAPSAGTGNITANANLSLTLSPAILNSVQLNPDTTMGRVVDVVVQDDTEVLSVDLQYCAVPPPPPVVVLNFQECGTRKEITLPGPWGPNTVKLFNPNELVVFDTNGTQQEQGYHPILWELDQNNWTPTGYTRLQEYGGWECATCPAPPGLIANNFLPQNYFNGGKNFKPNTLYYFGLAVGQVWTSTGYYFYIGP